MGQNLAAAGLNKNVWSPNFNKIKFFYKVLAFFYMRMNIIALNI